MKHTIEFFRDAIAEKGKMDAEELTLLYLIPLVQVAWAHGAVSPREAQYIFEVAREDGIDAAHWFNEKLDAFLIYQPSVKFFEDVLDLIDESFASMTVAERDRLALKLVARCEKIAAAAGDKSPMDTDHRISAEEREVLDRLRAMFIRSKGRSTA